MVIGLLTIRAASLRPPRRRPMRFLNPFDRTPQPTPPDLTLSGSIGADTLLPLLRSRWSFAGEALTGMIFDKEAPSAPAVAHVGSDLGVALVAERAGPGSAVTGAQLSAS